MSCSFKTPDLNLTNEENELKSNIPDIVYTRRAKLAKNKQVSRHVQNEVVGTQINPGQKNIDGLKKEILVYTRRNRRKERDIGVSERSIRQRLYDIAKEVDETAKKGN